MFSQGENQNDANVTLRNHSIENKQKRKGTPSLFVDESSNKHVTSQFESTIANINSQIKTLTQNSKTKYNDATDEKKIRFESKIKSLIDNEKKRFHL